MSWIMDMFNKIQDPINKMGFGDKDSFQQLGTQNQNQQNYQNDIFGGLNGGQSNIPGMEYLQSLFSDNPDAFKAFEAPMMRQFNEQTIPGIAERFSGMGAGSRNSSAFNNSAAMAGSRLSENMGAQRAGLRSGAMNQLQGFGRMGMGQSFENLHIPGQGGLLNGPGGAGIMQLLLSMLAG